MRIDIEIDDREARAGLNRLVERGDNLTDAMRVIAGFLRESAEESFAREAAPDGTPWQPLAPATLSEKRKRGYADTILQRQGTLVDSIQTDWDRRSAVAGTNIAYAAIHQFGGDIEQSARSISIPARPFLGVSRRYEDEIVGAIRDHLRATWRGG